MTTRRPLLSSTTRLLPLLLLTFLLSAANAQTRRTSPSTSAAPATAPAAAPRIRKTPVPDLVTDEQIVQAMKKAVDYLLLQRKGDSFETNNEVADHPGAATSVALFALLTASKSIDDRRLLPTSPELRGPVQYLTSLTPKSTYVGSVQANALVLLPPRPDVVSALNRIRGLLINSMHNDGGYYYFLDQQRNNPVFDLSNSQFGLLGAWAIHDAARQSVTSIPASYWATAERFWRSRQNADGGWAYNGGVGMTTTSMTAAGTAALFIVADATRTDLGLVPKPDPNLNHALAYLAKNFNPGMDDLYTLYGIERISLAGGLKYIGDKNWYQLGAQWLLSNQNDDGSFRVTFWPDKQISTVITSFALVFLARGRNPVAFNKLSYDGPWDARPRDVAYLTAWTGHQYEHNLTWQTVTTSAAAEDWLDAPILILNGVGDPNFSPELIDQLREYVELGGLIFSSANGSSREFTAAVEKAAAEMTHGRSSMTRLPRDHPIFTIHNRFLVPPVLFSVSNGVRELWVHSPEDFSATWQTRDMDKKEHWDLMANLYFYAAGKEFPHARQPSLAVIPARTLPSRTITLGRLQHLGNWDPEPGSFVRLARLAQANFHTNLRVQTVTFDNLDPRKIRVVHITGTGRFNPTADQTAQLRKFLDDGGTLWAEAAGGDPAFTTAFTSFARKLYPEAALTPLPDTDPLLLGRFADGVPIKSVQFRPFAAESPAKPDKLRLLAIHNLDRMLVLFSPYDTLSGYLGTRTWGINGYTPESSQVLARNILLYLNPTPLTAPVNPPATAPTAPPP